MWIQPKIPTNTAQPISLEKSSRRLFQRQCTEFPQFWITTHVGTILISTRKVTKLIGDVCDLTSPVKPIPSSCTMCQLRSKTSSCQMMRQPDLKTSSYHMMRKPHSKTTSYQMTRKPHSKTSSCSICQPHFFFLYVLMLPNPLNRSGPSSTGTGGLGTAAACAGCPEACKEIHN